MKKINKAGSILMFVLFLIFFGYGVYMAIYSIEYLATYTATSAVTAAGAFQYIMTSCISYFGFGFVFLAAALILHSFTGISETKKQQAPLSVDIPRLEESPSKPAGEAATKSTKGSDEKPVTVPTAGKVIAAPLASPSAEIADEAAAEIAAIALEADAGEPIESMHKKPLDEIAEEAAAEIDAIASEASFGKPIETPAKTETTEADDEERIEMNPASAAELAEELSNDAPNEGESFEVEYIYSEEPVIAETPTAEETSVAEELPAIDELDSIDKIPSIEELSLEIENELPADIKEEISLDIKDEIPVEVEDEKPAQEHESFRITSDFIKDILENK